MNRRFAPSVGGLVLLGLVAFLRAEPATQPSTQPAPRLPASFTLIPAASKDGPRSTWTRFDDDTWEEQTPGKKPIRYERIDAPIDPKDPGIILARLPRGDIQIFLPTLDNKDRRLGWRYPPGKEPKNAPPKGEGFDWYTLGESVDAKE